jgi:hypothetical protein
MMPGVTLEEIHSAILDAYDEDELRFTLRTLMNVRLNNIVKAAGFGTRVFDLLEWAERQGRATELIQVTAKARPRVSQIQQIYKKYGLAVPLYVEQAGATTVNTPTDAADAGLEKIVKAHLSFADFGVWRDRMTKVEGQVCLIRFHGNAQGTGFLVGSDAVLTNYHVMEPLLQGAKKAADVECLFDFKVLSDIDKTKTSTPVPLHATDWQIDWSPFSVSEKEGKPNQIEPTPDELDYTLFRLAEPVGAKPWAANPNPDGGAPLRGWVRVPDAAPLFKSPMGVLIAQHPSGWPLKFAIDTEGINQNNHHWLNANGTRVRYATSTLGGSSGSPVFDFDWNLIALHHYGDPAFSHPAQYNQGIPINKIREQLVKRGMAAALGGDPA